MCGGNIHLRVQEILAYSFQFDGAQYEPNLQTVLAKHKHPTLIKQFILSTIQCKNNDILPQEGNDETANIQEHTCEAKWDGLQSRRTI